MKRTRKYSAAAAVTLILLLSAAAILAACCTRPKMPGLLSFERRVILKRQGEGAYAIPKMIVTGRGTVVIVLQDRMGGDWGKPIHPVMLRSQDGGTTWSGPTRISRPLDEGGRFHVKPTGIVEDRHADRILVFLVRSPIATPKGEQISERWFYANIQRCRALGRAWFLVSSDDEGRTWSDPREITCQLIQKPHWQEWSPVHTGIQLQSGPHSGRLVVPVRCFCPDEDPSELDWRNQTNSLIFSDDGGKTWQGGERTGPEVGECCIAEISEGNIYVNQRIAPEGEKMTRSYVISRNGGATFSERGDHPDLIDVKCHAGLISSENPQGRRVLLLSHVPGPGRRGLTLSLSADEAKTWDHLKILEPRHAAYSDLAITADGVILCVYETGEKSSRRDIALTRFSWNWLYAREQTHDSR